MDLSFLSNLLSNQPDEKDPNSQIDQIKDSMAINDDLNDSPGSHEAIDSNLKERLANAQPYPLAPLDMKKDQFNALQGILPDKDSTYKGDVQYPNSPMDQDPNNNFGDLFSLFPGKAPLPPVVPPVPKTPPQATDPSRAPASIAGNPAGNPAAPTIPDMPPVPTATANLAPAPQDASAQQDPYEKMLADKRDQMRMLNMMEGADQIGQAIAGQGHVAYRPGTLDSAKKQAEMQAEDFIKAQQQKQEKAKFDLSQQKGKLDLESLQRQANDDKAKHDKTSDISQFVRASTIDNLNKIGATDLAAKIKASNPSAAELESTLGNYNLSNMVTQHEAQLNRVEIAKLRQATLQNSQQTKMDAQDTKRLDQANHAISAGIASSRGAFGKAATIHNQAERIEALIAQQPTGQMDNRQIQELARSLDSMLSNGAATITGTAHLIPRSYSGDVAKIQEYIGNIPKGARQAAFVQKMADTVAREKTVARNQIQRESKGILGSYGDLAKKHPDAWKLMLKTHNLPEDIFGDDSDSGFNVDQNKIAEELKKRGGQ